MKIEEMPSIESLRAAVLDTRLNSPHRCYALRHLNTALGDRSYDHLSDLEMLTRFVDEHETAARKAEAYVGLPQCVISWIESQAYERGHSAGQSEVDSIACGIAADIKPLLEQLKVEFAKK